MHEDFAVWRLRRRVQLEWDEVELSKEWGRAEHCLVLAGVSPYDIPEMADAELLKISLIGVGTLALIRSRFPKPPPHHCATCTCV